MDYQQLKGQLNSVLSSASQGISVEEIRSGYAQVTKTIKPGDFGPQKDNVYYILADTACAVAAISQGHAVENIGYDFTFLGRAKVGDKLSAESEEMPREQPISVYKVKIKDQAGTLLSVGTFTLRQLS